MDIEQRRAYARKYQAERVARLKDQPFPEGVNHGTVNAYNNYSCRCEACVEAYRVYQLPLGQQRKEKGLAPDDKRHGTYNGYANYGCRCAYCVEANRVYSLGYRLKTGQITEWKYDELMAKGL